jgi:hypothetical protein
VADAGFSGVVFGKGRNNSRVAQQRDNSSFVQLGRVNGGRGGAGWRGGRRNMGNDRV